MGNNDDALLISTIYTLKPTCTTMKKLIIIQHYTNTNKSMSLSFQLHASSKHGILDDAFLILAALFSSRCESGRYIQRSALQQPKAVDYLIKHVMARSCSSLPLGYSANLLKLYIPAVHQVLACGDTAVELACWF
jgi:hypothetical protein